VESVELIVIHSISVPAACHDRDGIDALFTNSLKPDAHPGFPALSGLRVSAHFVIDRVGRLTQFVSCRERAWHAGASQWRGRSRCNDFSVGIELIGSEFEPFTDRQYISLNDLVGLLARSLPIVDVCGHEHIAPDRKFDPGPYFDWQRVVLERHATRNHP
jgi:AmpD protein